MPKRENRVFNPATLYEGWLNSLVKSPDKCVVMDSHGRSYTYAQADGTAGRLAGYLLEHGVKAGSVVSCQLPGWAEFLPIYIACLKIGAVINPIPPNLRFHELGQMLTRCSSSVLFLPRRYRKYTYCDMAGELEKACPHLRALIAIDKYGEGSRLAEFDDVVASHMPLAQDDTPMSASDDLAVIMFTSGSEGEPKGVMFSHRNIIAAERAFAEFFEVGSDDIMFMPAPVAHAIGFHHGVSLPFLAGATTVLQDHFQAEEALDLMRRHKVTLTMATTPFLHDILPCWQDASHRPEHLRFFLCGGAPPNLCRVREAASMGLKVLNVYGSTESVPHMGTPPHASDEQILRQALFPMPGIRVRVADRAGHTLADGLEGEELSSSDAVFMGYLDMPDATARTLRDGWYHSGDLCRRNADGSFSITGRLKDIVVRGGENISCLEVENILLENENIMEAAVVPMPDERLQERICAYVTLADAAKILSLEDVAAHFASRNVAKLKYPEHLEILSDMPRTHSGKIDKAGLARKIAEKKTAK